MTKTYYCPKSCESHPCKWRSEASVRLTSEPEDANYNEYCPMYLNNESVKKFLQGDYCSSCQGNSPDCAENCENPERSRK